MNARTRFLPARLRAALAALVVAIAVVSCSFVRLTYDNADWLIHDRIDRLLDLTEAQRQELAPALEQVMAVHRREQLPAIAAWLDALGHAFESGTDIDEIDRLAQAGRGHVRASLALLVPPVAAVLSELEPAQRAHFARALDTRDRERRARSRIGDGPQARRERRIERAVEQIERVTGPLDDGQLAMIGRAVDEMPDSGPAWMDYARARYDAVLASVDAGLPAGELEALLRFSYVEMGDMPAPLRARWTQSFARWITLADEIENSLSEAQRRHAVDYVRELRDDARALAAAGT